MERGRSPSVGRHNASNPHSRSPSAHAGFNPLASARGTNPVLLQGGGGGGGGSSSSFTSNPSLDVNNTQNPFNGSFDNASYLRGDLSQTLTQDPNANNQSFMQDFGGQQKHPFSQPDNYNQTSHQDFTNGTLEANSLQGVDPQYLNTTGSDHNQQLDSSFLFDATPTGEEQQITSQNPDSSAFFDSVGQVSSGGSDQHPQNSQAYFQESALSSAENSPMTSDMRNFPSHSPHRSRSQSLDPASAAFPQGQIGSEWTAMGSYGGHHRQPSDGVSEASSHPSPYIQDADSFEPLNGNAPLFNDQSESNLPPEMLGLNQFSLADSQYPHSQHYSPAHSLHSSPHLSPQQNLSQFTSGDDFGLFAPQPHFGGGAPSPQFFDAQENFPSMQQPATTGADMNGATQISAAPAIEIDLAPAQDKQQQMSNDSRPHPRRDSDALHPPSRSASRPRGRAGTDPYATGSGNGSRSSTPARARAPSLGVPQPQSRAGSRSPSPSGPPNGVQKPRDRASSTSSIPQNRDRMLELAEAYRQESSPPGHISGASSDRGASPSSTGGNSARRAQKHPATFQCSLCPKRFTRAYNLRSHLRTHTDERPFVCTVCGKAFARQHDRKRHEGLHSGEKKFVCRGLLAGGAAQEGGQAATWGCGRRFARADALGRHFRSEAGRACIKPLLDEEARERQTAMMEQQSQDMLNQSAQGGLASQQGMPASATGQMDVSGMTLPAALLAQYPALAGIQWDALPPAGGAGGIDEGSDIDLEGRSSFEASSGGEWDLPDDLSASTGMDPNGFGGDGGMSDWAMGMGQQGQQQHAQQPQNMAVAGSGNMWHGQGGAMGYGGQ